MSNLTGQNNDHLILLTLD